MSESVVVADRELPTTNVGKLEPNYFCRAWNPRREKYCGARAGSGTDHVGVGRCSIHNGGGENRVVHGQRRRYPLQTPRIGELLEHHAADPDPFNVREELDLARSVLQDWIERYEDNTEALLAWHASFKLRHGPVAPEKEEALRRVLDEYQELQEGRDGLTEKQAADLALARAYVDALSAPPVERPRKVLDVSASQQLIGEVTRIVERVENARAKNAITYDQLKRFLFAVERVLEVRITDAAVRQQIADDLLRIQP